VASEMRRVAPLPDKAVKLTTRGRRKAKARRSSPAARG